MWKDMDSAPKDRAILVRWVGDGATDYAIVSWDPNESVWAVAHIECDDDRLWRAEPWFHDPQHWAETADLPS